MGVKEDTLRRHYKKKWNGFQLWNQLTHAYKYLLYAHNITSHMAIDEVSLSQGELYTILSSRDRLGRSGKVAAVIRGTKAEAHQSAFEIAGITARISQGSNIRYVHEHGKGRAVGVSSCCLGVFPPKVENN